METFEISCLAARAYLPSRRPSGRIDGRRALTGRGPVLAGMAPAFCSGHAHTRCVAAPRFSLRGATLLLTVSRDEESVSLRALAGGREVALGERVHNLLLLALARERRADAARGVPDPSCGWMYADDLAHGLRRPLQQLNLDVFRLRRHLARRGVVDADGIVERRLDTRQLRLGSARFEIVVS